MISKGAAVPLRYESGSSETGFDNPLSSARRTRPRRHGAGIGIVPRQSCGTIHLQQSKRVFSPLVRPPRAAAPFPPSVGGKFAVHTEMN